VIPDRLENGERNQGRSSRETRPIRSQILVSRVIDFLHNFSSSVFGRASVPASRLFDNSTKLFMQVTSDSGDWCGSPKFLYKKTSPVVGTIENSPAALAPGNFRIESNAVPKGRLNSGVISLTKFINGTLISATLERRILCGLPLPFVTKTIYGSADSLVRESAKSPPILFSAPTENVKESKGFLAFSSGIDGSSFRAATVLRERPSRAVHGTFGRASVPASRSTIRGHKRDSPQTAPPAVCISPKTSKNLQNRLLTHQTHSAKTST
jgi:hypothetical protein